MTPADTRAFLEALRAISIELAHLRESVDGVSNIVAELKGEAIEIGGRLGQVVDAINDA